MRVIRSLALWPVAFLLARTTAQSFSINIFPGTAPYTPAGAEREHVANTSEGRVVSNVTVPTLTIYKPVGGAASGRMTAPAVLVLPGGAFEHLYLDKEGTWVASWLNSLGFVAAVLKYRVPLGLPKTNVPGLHNHTSRLLPDMAAEIYRPLADTQRAMGILRANADAWGLNASSVGVLGFSAGGSLAAFLCTHSHTRLYPVGPGADAADRARIRPDFMMAAYPVPLVGALVPDPNQGSPLDELLPGLEVDQTVPPSFVVQAQDDPFGPQHAVAWWLANNRVGNKAELGIFPLGGHGFATCHQQDAGDHEVCAWTTRAELWLDRTLRIARTPQ